MANDRDTILAEDLLDDSPKTPQFNEEPDAKGFNPYEYLVRMREEFHIPEPVLVVNDRMAGRVEGLSQHAVAWYEPSTDRISVNLEKMANVCAEKELSLEEMLGRTLFHETVGHYGLRLLLGEKFERTMEHIYDNASLDLSQRLQEKRAHLEKSRDSHGHNLYKQSTELSMKVLTVEEYMSELAERLHKDPPKSRNIIQSFAQGLCNAMKRMGFTFHLVREKDLEWMLERSYYRVRSRNPFVRPLDWFARNWKVPFTENLRAPFRKHTFQYRNPLSHQFAQKDSSSAWKKPMKVILTIAFPVAMVPYLVFRQMTKRQAIPGKPGPVMPVSRELLGDLDIQHREKERNIILAGMELLCERGVTLSPQQQQSLRQGRIVKTHGQDGTSYAVQRICMQSGEYKVNLTPIKPQSKAASSNDRQQNL